jgi:hypothetical protein
MFHPRRKRRIKINNEIIHAASVPILALPGASLGLEDVIKLLCI